MDVNTKADPKCPLHCGILLLTWDLVTLKGKNMYDATIIQVLRISRVCRPLLQNNRNVSGPDIDIC